MAGNSTSLPDIYAEPNTRPAHARYSHRPHQYPDINNPAPDHGGEIDPPELGLLLVRGGAQGVTEHQARQPGCPALYLRLCLLVLTVCSYWTWHRALARDLSMDAL